MVVVVLSVVFLLQVNTDMGATWQAVVSYSYLSFTSFFFLEMVAKLLALGVRGYFSSGWNWFDCLVERAGCAVVRAPSCRVVAALAKQMPSLFLGPTLPFSEATALPPSPPTARWCSWALWGWSSTWPPPPPSPSSQSSARCGCCACSGAPPGARTAAPRPPGTRVANQNPPRLQACPAAQAAAASDAQPPTPCPHRLPTGTAPHAISAPRVRPRRRRPARLIPRFKGLRTLLTTLWWSLPALVNVGSVLVLMIFVYAIIVRFGSPHAIVPYTQSRHPLLRCGPPTGAV